MHPNLFLACQLPNNRMGDQIFVQFIQAIAGRMWFFQYGRMEMGFTGADAYFKVRHLSNARCGAAQGLSL